MVKGISKPMVKKEQKQNLRLKDKGDERKWAVENHFNEASLGNCLGNNDVRKTCNIKV